MKFSTMFLGPILEHQSRKLNLLSLTSLEEETAFLMDVKRLYTNVSVMEANELACEVLFTSGSWPPRSRPTFKSLMELAVTNVWFMCSSECYIQRWYCDGRLSSCDTREKLAEKKQEKKIAAEERQPRPPKMNKSTIHLWIVWEECITSSVLSLSILCDDCKRWFHRWCVGLSLKEIKDAQPIELVMRVCSAKVKSPLRAKSPLSEGQSLWTACGRHP